MFSSAMVLAISVTLQAAPADVDQTVPTQQAYSGANCPTCNTTYGQPGVAAGITYGATDELFPFDHHAPWLHGYFQEIPAYGGFGAFRPYNYKHVLAQSRVAAGWGMRSQMPYSQQFWHRYQCEAALQTHVPRHEWSSTTGIR